MAERQAHALLRQAMANKGLNQRDVATLLGCSASNISQLLAGSYRLSDERKLLARNLWGIPIETWSLAPSEDANDASRCEEPQAARTSSIPPSRQAEYAAASEPCPAAVPS